MSTLTTIDRAAAQAAYERDGYYVFRNVLDADLMGEVRDHITWLQQKYPGRILTEIGAPHLPTDAFWARLISDPRLVEIGSLFEGDDLALFAANYLIKEPRTGKRVEWHQDGPVWPLEPHEVVTLWLAIDHVDKENGCLRVVPGSHKLGALPVKDLEGDGNFFNFRVDADISESDAVDLPMEPGDVEVHHPLLFHSSNANTSERRRAGMNIHYIPTTTMLVSEEQPYPGGALWLRGERGRNNYNPMPRYVEGESFPFDGSNAWA
jgi:ectoine hydroxylase-related dioxygenase (phytanoyl-CoA dioxygenase family)